VAPKDLKEIQYDWSLEHEEGVERSKTGRKQGQESYSTGERGRIKWSVILRTCYDSGKRHPLCDSHSPEPLQGRECSGLEPFKPEAETQYPKFPSQLLLEDQSSPVVVRQDQITVADSRARDSPTSFR